MQIQGVHVEDVLQLVGVVRKQVRPAQRVRLAQQDAAVSGPDQAACRQVSEQACRLRKPALARELMQWQFKLRTCRHPWRWSANSSSWPPASPAGSARWPPCWLGIRTRSAAPWLPAPQTGHLSGCSSLSSDDFTSPCPLGFKSTPNVQHAGQEGAVLVQLQTHHKVHHAIICEEDTPKRDPP